MKVVTFYCDIIILLFLLLLYSTKNVVLVVRGSADVDDWGDDDYWEEEEYDDEDDDDDAEDTNDTIVTKFGPENDEKGSDIGVSQEDYDDIDVGQRIIEARKYIKDVIMPDPKYEIVRPLCHNRNPKCAYWAAVQDECNNDSAAYMQINCAPVCFACDKLHIETRCPLNPNNATNALPNPGDLNQFFERIVTNPYYKQKYQPTVLSRPHYPDGEGPTNTTYQLGMWLIQLENIVSPEEAKTIIDLGAAKGYERSADVADELNPDGTHNDEINNDRTSTNAWCDEECYEHPASRIAMGRMENITGIPETNQEWLQILRYQQGQFYTMHNDYIDHDIRRQYGVRILTFYLYLSDVEEGGETTFPRIGLSVKPKTGRAVLWPSVFDYDPNKNDIRSDHQANPVIKGMKYGANAWYHQRDYKGVPDECQ